MAILIDSSRIVRKMPFCSSPPRTCRNKLSRTSQPWQGINKWETRSRSKAFRSGKFDTNQCSWSAATNRLYHKHTLCHKLFPQVRIRTQVPLDDDDGCSSTGQFPYSWLMAPYLWLPINLRSCWNKYILPEYFPSIHISSRQRVEKPMVVFPYQQ